MCVYVCMYVCMYVYRVYESLIVYASMKEFQKGTPATGACGAPFCGDYVSSRPASGAPYCGDYGSSRSPPLR